MTGRVTRLLASHALSATAMSLPWPALLALTWKVEPGLVGAVGAARMAPYVLLSWAVGGIGDRLGRLRVLKLSAWLRVPLLAGAGVLVVAGQPLASAVLACLAVAAGTPAFPSLAAELPGEEASDEATGWLVTIEVSAFVVGPALGGLLLGTAGAASGLALASALALAGALALGGLSGRPDAARGASQQVSWRTGIAALARSQPVWGAIAVVMAVNAALAALGVALLPLSELVWQAGEPEFGLATAALGFGSLATPVLVRLLRPLLGLRAPLLAVVLLPLLAVTWAPSWTLALGPLALFGAAATLVECETTRILQRGAPPRYRALALGVADTAMISAALIGSAVGPWAASHLGPTGLVVALVLVVGIVGWWGLGRGLQATAHRAEPHRTPRRCSINTT